VLDGAVVVPHPRAHERLFVMGPLAEIAPVTLAAADLARSADGRRGLRAGEASATAWVATRRRLEIPDIAKL
jgi:2-amino-4-hydroxy-6-hydroxymethyldihydropteridine diphosphokinase